MALHAQVPASPEFVEGEALVRFRAGKAHGVTTSLGLRVTKTFRGLSHRKHSEFALVSAPGLAARDLVAQLRRLPHVEAAEFNYIRRVAARRPGNDPRFSEQWALSNTGQVVGFSTGTPGADIGWMEGMRLLQPTGEVVVAVIDTGVAYYHEELRNRVWTNTGEIPTNGIDDDANGYVDDVHGHDFSSEATGPDDDAYGHGTLVAGIIAAEWNNAAGIAGVCPQAKIMALRALNSGGGATDAQLVEAIDYAVMMKTSGVPVVAINASWGGYGGAAFIEAAIADAGDAGIVFCAAAGNDSLNNDVQPFYPASSTLSNVIAVGACMNTDGLWSASNYGLTKVDLFAPGENILMTLPRGSGVTFGGNDHDANKVTFSPDTPPLGITGMTYDCGFGAATSFPPAVTGSFALMKTGGGISVPDKVANAMAAGASAAIIFNNISGNFTATLGGASNWINAVTLSLEDGMALQALAPTPALIIANGRVDFELGYGNGTSYAAPHVAGAIALLALAFPDDSPTQRIARVLAGAEARPAFAGRCVTGGRLDLARSLDADTDGIGDWWELRHATNLVTMTAASDTDADGVTDADEFAADTNPNDASSHLRIANLDVTETNIVLRWPGTPARLYNLHTTTNLTAAWTPAHTGIIATLPNTIVTNQSPGPGKFFRLELDW